MTPPPNEALERKQAGHVGSRFGRAGPPASLSFAVGCELEDHRFFDLEHLPEENIFVFPTASSTRIATQGARRTVANCTPAG